MIEELKPLIGKLSIFAKDRMGFSHPPRLFIKQNKDNANKMLGRTAHYDPSNESVTLYVTARHPKDILRSYAHELVHHAQNLRGDLTPGRLGPMGKNYAQDNDHMRNMEKEAYLQGNMCFRDFEDTLGDKDIYTIKIAESKFLKENRKVNANKLTELIRGIVKNKLAEAPNQSVMLEPFDTGIGNPRRVFDAATAREFLNSYEAQQMKGGRSQRFLDRAQEFIDREETGAAAIKKNTADVAAAKNKKAAAAAALKKKNPYNSDFAKFFNDTEALNLYASMVPSDPAEKTKWYANTQNASTIQAMARTLSKLRSQDVSLLTKNSNPGVGAPDRADLNAMIAPYLKKMAIQGASTPGDPPPAPAAPEIPATPETDVDTDTAIASTTPVVPQAQMGGVAEPPAAPVGTPVGAAAASAGGGFSASQRRRKKRQQTAIIRRGDMRGFGTRGIRSIEDLQQRLIDSGFAKYDDVEGGNFVDGDFGGATIRAVQKLQRALGYKGSQADGVIGKNTIARINAKAKGNNQINKFRIGVDDAAADTGPDTGEPSQDKEKDFDFERDVGTGSMTKADGTRVDNSRRARDRAFARSLNLQRENKNTKGKMSRKITKSLLREIIEKQLEAFGYETQSEAAVPPPHPYDIEDQYGSMGSRSQSAAAPVQDVLKMISNISSDGKITGQELVDAGKKLMQQSGGSSYRDSQEFRDDYAANQDQLDDLAAYQNMEEGSEELEEVIGKNISKLKGGLEKFMKKKAEKKKKTDKKEPAGETSQDAPMSVPADDYDPPAEEGEKPDFSDIDKDGNKGESAKGAAKDAEKAEKNESKIQTPEQENFLYESRFTGRNTRIYEQLVKNWTK